MERPERMGSGEAMRWNENVERKLIYYRDFHVRQKNISEFLRRFIV